jgi:hypothetical protein
MYFNFMKLTFYATYTLEIYEENENILGYDKASLSIQTKKNNKFQDFNKT